MKIKKNYLEELKQKSEENKNKRAYPKWQEYACSVCKEFDITKETTLDMSKDGKPKWKTVNYQAVIYRHACNNLSYLQGKVELAKDKFNGDVQGKGNYLIKLFSKKKPWEK